MALLWCRQDGSSDAARSARGSCRGQLPEHALDAARSLRRPCHRSNLSSVVLEQPGAGDTVSATPILKRAPWFAASQSTAVSLKLAASISTSAVRSNDRSDSVMGQAGSGSCREP